jgi:hypothetical protein
VNVVAPLCSIKIESRRSHDQIAERRRIQSTGVEKGDELAHVLVSHIERLSLSRQLVEHSVSGVID